MPVWFAPVDDAATMLGVDLHVDRTMRCAPVLDTHALQARDQRVELSFTHAETVVLNRKSIFCLIYVERQPFVDVHRTERTHASLCPRHSKNACQQFRCRPSISRRHDRVVKLNAHPRMPTFINVARFLASAKNGHGQWARAEHWWNVKRLALRAPLH